MAKKYIVDLKKDEKAELIALTQKGRSGARKIKRANILLLSNTGKPDFEIAELSIGISRSPMPCVQFTRDKFKKLYPAREE